ncbi:acetyl-coenzyme A transporter 1-domain-containing protein [Russula emetica]|nr:acetyl-coenzyme A transporter 1-domain-containing protein [Russula emetica]
MCKIYLLKGSMSVFRVGYPAQLALAECGAYSSGAYNGHVPGSAEEVEMGLLAGDEHASRFREDLGDGSEDEDGKYEDSEESQSEVAQAMRGDVEMKAPLTREDKKAMALLIVLSRPSNGYPYSLKLLWSPIVDAWFFPTIGRRRSWIIPMQTILGSLMLWMSFNVQTLLDNAIDHIYVLTVVFTLLVVIAATQDIAVDGWSLTLLSRENLPYASTCQTVGLTIGWLMSFTVFLALNSEAFSARWGTPILTLGTYLRFWSIACFGVTSWLVLVQKERLGIRSFLMVHLVGKIGFAAHDAATSLKMVEKGLGKEDFAVAVLLDFPIQIVFGYLVARWSRGERPLRPWIWSYWPRFVFAFLAAIILWKFPAPPITIGFFAFLVIFRSFGEMAGPKSYCSTTQFVSIGAFHAKISDPVIGGTYITLLNTVSNLGSTWPRFFVLRAIDYFSIASCEVDGDSASSITKGAECVSEEGKAMCIAAAGTCVMERDGYYITTGICLAVGLLFFVAYIIPTAKRLQALPLTKWRITI